MDINWLAFYIWLHLLLTILLLPALVFLVVGQLALWSPASMLQVMDALCCVAVLIAGVVVTALGAGSAAIALVYVMVFSKWSVLLRRQCSSAGSAQTLAMQQPSPSSAMVQVQWPLLSQLLVMVNAAALVLVAVADCHLQSKDYSC